MSLLTVFISVWVENHVSGHDSFRATHQVNVAPAVTTLLCLLVISLESLICRFVNLFLCCWQKSERLHRPGQASESVAFRAAVFTKCLFSLRSEEEGQTACYLGTAFVNKTWVFGFSFLFCPTMSMSAGKSIGQGEPWEQRWHQSRPGFPSSRSRSQLRVANETQQWGGMQLKGTCTSPE